MNNYKPSWEDLRSLNIFEEINGKEYLPIKSFKRFVAFVQEHKDTIANLPDNYPALLRLSKEDYEKICIIEHVKPIRDSFIYLSFLTTDDLDISKEDARRCFARQPGDDD